MRSEDSGHEDPLWGLTLEIASKLWFDGRYAFEMDPLPHQRLVNVHWAALRAGRLLGVRAKVKMIGPFSRTDPTVRVTITFDDPDRRGKARAQEGLEALLRPVAEQRRR